MATSSFGKRGVSTSVDPTRVGGTLSAEQARFFAELRESAAGGASVALTVPRSVRATMLAGLVVGCCLSGLDVARTGEMLNSVAHLLPPGFDATRMVPGAILLGLLGGARAAATNLLVAHALLRRAGWTSHAAYALGCAGVAAVFSVLLHVLAQTGLPIGPGLAGHGSTIDIAAGAGAGFLYRMFAGARSA